ARGGIGPGRGGRGPAPRPPPATVALARAGAPRRRGRGALRAARDTRRAGDGGGMGGVGEGERGVSGARARHPGPGRAVVRGVAAAPARKSGARWAGKAPGHRHHPDQEGNPGGRAACGPSPAPGRRRCPLSRQQLLSQVLLLWALAFHSILVAYLVYSPAAKVVSVAVFLYLPLWSMRRSNEEPADVGLSLSNWRADVLWAAGLFAVIAVGYFLGMRWWLSWHLAHGRVGPPPGLAFHPQFPRFWEHAINQPYVVSLP